jgi:hypothetical protein
MEETQEVRTSMPMFGQLNSSGDCIGALMHPRKQGPHLQLGSNGFTVVPQALTGIQSFPLDLTFFQLISSQSQSTFLGKGATTTVNSKGRLGS